MILIDDRQIVEHPEIPKLLGLESTVLRLEAADYCFVDGKGIPTGIEQSEVGNLIQKIRSGELEFQMRNCQKYYEAIILLIEGVYDSFNGLLSVYKVSSTKGKSTYYRKFVYPSTTYEYLISTVIRLSEMGVELVHSPNLACSIDIVRYIYKQRTKTEEEHTLFKKVRKVEIPTKLTTNPAVSKLMGLVPRLPERIAIDLINRFGSIWGVLHAEDSELLEVKGLGKGLVSNMKISVGRSE